MSGVTPLVDTLLATRLAQRPDLLPLKAQAEIAGPGAVAHAEKVVNDVRLPSRAALEQQLGVALSRGGDGGPASLSAGSGGGVTLSAVARAISAILAPQGGAELKIRGAEPLWPHRRPPAAPVLAAKLARAVNGSGLFYEAHLQQFAAGSRALAQLMREPQAALVLPEVSAVPEDADTDGRSLLPPRPGAGTAAADKGSQPGSAPAARPAAPVDSVHSAASYGRTGKPETGPATFHDVAGQEPDAQAPAANAVAASGNNAPAPAAIHPDAVALVRQQLELLALPVFRWGGEAWPGTPMDWEIREEQGERPADGEPAQPAWVTHLSLSLPSLKAVEVRLALSGVALQVHFTSEEDATLAVLEEGRQTLARRFDAVGLQVTGLQFRARAAEKATQGIREQEGAA